MKAEEFKTWRKSLGLSQRRAADALGLKNRIVQYYEKGERNGEKVKIPKHVRLACCALSMGITDYHGPEAAEQAEREVEVKQRRPKKAGSTGPAAGGAEPGVGLE
ncbi:MAG: helix-turn-helix transcriptional regulator [Geminicoccaceae bacterium]